MFYFLNPPKKNGERLLFFRFCYHGYRLTLSTGITIHPDKWDTKRQLPKRTHRDYPKIKAVLDKWDRVMNETLLTEYLEGIPKPEKLTDAFYKALQLKSNTINLGYRTKPKNGYLLIVR